MKIIDKYLLKSFLITFTTVFVILFFIFILQTVWLFISELAGKDLDFLLVVKFLLFSMPRIIPLVLPLSVLLASIMTFGSLAENYEFAAMKSAGISFQRSMFSITAFIVVLSIVSFFFANNVIPYAEYKFINFRRNIAQVKPAMAIAEGQFSEVGNYTIKVEKKSGEKGNFLTGVTIHRKLDNGEGSTTVIKAEKGELVSSESSNTLKLVLTNGSYYEDIIPTKFEERDKIPFAKGTFKKDVINIDLSKLNQTNMESVDISNTTNMLNLKELRFTLDSLNTDYKKDLSSTSENIYLRTGIANTYYAYTPNKATTDKDTTKAAINTDLLSNLSAAKKLEIYKFALNNIENTGFSIDSSVFELDNKAKNINGHWIALYDKFMIAFSCLLMFFIGAPLGAIIRKGGLGLPIVFAVAIFITFHFINTFGKRVAQENGMSAFLGVWLSSIVLTPLAILLTYRAINDIGGAISFDWIQVPFQKLFKKKAEAEVLEPTLAYGIANQQVEGMPKTTVKETPVKKVKPIIDLAKVVAAYHKDAKTALLIYAIIFVVPLPLLFFNTTIALVVGGLLLLALLYFIYTAQKKIETIAEATEQVIEPGLAIALLVAFPFYILVYLYQKKAVEQLPNP